MSKSYIQFGKRYTDDAYNLPIDTIYYLESAQNHQLNAYMRENLTSLERYLNLAVRHRVYFPIKLVYISRQSDELFFALQSLHPELRGVVWDDSLVSYSEIRQISFTSHLFPANEGEYHFWNIDTGDVDTDDLRQVLCDYVKRIVAYNRTILESGRDDVSDDAITCDLELLYSHSKMDSCKRFSISNRPHAFDSDASYFSPDESIELSEDDWRREQEEKRKEEELRAKALALKAAIDGLQRESGITILSEILGRDIIEQLRAEASETQPLPAGSLTIDESHEILIPEFDMHIPMQALQKALYVLFLRHPEGILRTALDEHKDELRQIYLKLTERGDMQALNRSIDELVEPESDSLNQKISKINAAFRNRLAEDLAARFIITGPRGEAKRVLVAAMGEVALPESLKF